MKGFVTMEGGRAKLLAASLLLAVVCFACKTDGGYASGGEAVTPAGSGSNYIRNGGFENAAADGTGLPTGWFQDVRKTGNKGSISLSQDRYASGNAAVRIVPNKNNDKKFPIALAQEIPAADLRGKEVVFSGQIATEGGARALIGLLNVAGGRQGEFSMIFQGPSEGQWQSHQKSYRVPDDPDVKLYLSIWVAGNVGEAWFDDISVRVAGAADNGGGGTAPVPAEDNAPPPATAAYSIEAEVTVDAGRVVRQIPRSLYGANVEWRWNATSLWQERERRVDPVGQQLAAEMGISIIRYPGGIYSDHYHWRDGIGPYDQRPEVQHEPGKDDRSRPNFGTDEALRFADDTGAELLITVNIVTGTAEEAADWVRYVNKDRLRVRYWEIGNEQYIKSGSPVSLAATMKPAEYARKVREFAKAMKAADPRIKTGVIGGLNEGIYKQMNYRRWNDTVIREAGQYADFFSVHNAYAPVLTGDEKNRDLRTVYSAMLGRPQGIARNLARQAEQLRQLYPDESTRPFIAVTEWGPIFQFYNEGSYVDHPKTLGSALFVASTLKAFVESPDTQLAAFWMLNDFGVLGWMGSANGDFPPRPEWVPTARYFAFQLFSRHFGSQLIASETRVASMGTSTVGWSAAERDVPYLDVVASLSDDGRQLYIIAINKHFDAAVDTTLNISNFVPEEEGVRWLLAGTGIDAHTGTEVIRVPGLKWGKQVTDGPDGRFMKGSRKEVTLQRSATAGMGSEFDYTFPPHSVTSLVLTRQ